MHPGVYGAKLIQYALPINLIKKWNDDFVELSLLLGKQVLSMLVMMLVGIFAAKTHLVDSSANKSLSTLVLYIFSPCALLAAFQMDFDAQKLVSLGVVTFFAVIAHLFFILMAQFVFFRKKTAFSNANRAALIYTNCGNLTIPLISATLGQEAVFYSCGYMLVSSILLWTHGRVVMSEDIRSISVKNIVFNSNIIAIVVGLGMFLTGLRFPSVLDSAVNSYSGAMGAVSMLALGLMLGGNNLKEIFADKRVYWVCFLRLIALPLLLILFFKFTGLAYIVSNGKELLTVVLIAAFAPVAAAVAMFAQLFEKNPDYASRLTGVSTMLSIASMPLMVAASQILL